MKKYLIGLFVLLTAVSTTGTILPHKATALSGSSFKSGRIIDDVTFFTPGTMSVTDIQNFLNAKVPVCDTNGTQQTSHPNGSGGYYTRAQWGALNGSPAPYTCLKDYRQTPSSKPAESGLCSGYTGGTQQTAAQIIYNVSQSCDINPKVLLVLLQKEQSLVTDDWPWPVEYRSATGYGCPDTAPCDAEYYGFFNQVYAAARQYRYYAHNPESFNYRADFTNNILYNPSASCGSSGVFIENQATAGLYNYTPYQPNAAALANLYGNGDSCSSYGNRNFWRMYNDWFGTTINDAYAWDMVQDSTNGKIYLMVDGVSHWIPGPSLMNAWGLDKFNYRGVDGNYIKNFSAGADLTYVGLDINGNRYLMSGGKKYLLPNDNYVLAWGVAGMTHIPAAGPLTQIPSGGTAGRFAQDSADGKVYLLDGVSKHLGLSAQSLSYWGQSASNTTVVTSDVLTHLPTGAPVDRYVNAGGSDMIIDQSTALTFKNSAMESAWGLHTYVPISSYATNLLTKKAATNFIIASGDSRWYYIEGGHKHYISNTAYAQIWGWGTSDPLLTVSADLASQFNALSNLSYIAKAASTGNTYIVDGSKHLLANATYASLWTGTQTPSTFTDDSFNLLSAGSNIQTANVGFANYPRLYSVDNGQLRYIPGPTILNALGQYSNNPIVTLSQTLQGLMPQGTAIDMVLKDGSGTAYYIENGSRYTISSNSLNTWAVSSSTPTVTSTYLNAFTDTGKSVGTAVTVSGHKYLVNSRTLLDVTNDFENYGLSSSDFTAISQKILPVSQTSTYLVGTPGSNKIWLLSMGDRYYVHTPDVLYDLGFGRTTGITSLNQDIVNNLPEQTAPAGQLLRVKDGGAVFASTGRGFGFQTSGLLTDYSQGQTIFTLPAADFNKFPFVGWTSQLVAGSDGKVYAMDNGQKHWVSGPSLLKKYYSGQSILWLPQSTINAIPSGTAITS